MPCFCLGVRSKSQLSRGVFTKLYLFQVINVFFASIISNSVFQELQLLLDHPSDLLTILGKTVPGTGGFFINYVMLQGTVDLLCSV